MLRVYSLLHYLAMPAILAYLAWLGIRRRGYFARVPERFGFGPVVDAPEGSIWVHAVSVGEVQACVPLVRALRERLPGLPVVVTTTTPTGSERVKRVLDGEVEHAYVPYDLPGSVARFLARARPRVTVIMETELWPNIVHICARRSVPVLIANARMSERSAAGYRRVPGLARSMLERVNVAAQSPADAQRFVALGAAADRVHVVGNIKLDVRLPPSLSEEGAALRRRFGPGRSVWIAASTHQGEDQLVLDAFAVVRATMPDCLLVLVPRHPERSASIAALCRRRGYRTVLRTEDPDTCEGFDVYLGDTIGDLPLQYAASDVAFVGGSLVGIGGHNVLEPAALGVPVVVGPHVFNFSEVTARLCESGGARQVPDPEALGAAVRELLGDANLRHAAGERGRAFVEENRGALDTLVAMVGELAGAPRRVAGPPRADALYC